MGDSPSSDSGSNNESRMSPGRATAQFGSEVGSLAGGYTESQVQDAINQNDSSDSPRTNVEIAREARIPGTFTQQSQNYVDDFRGATDDRAITPRSTLSNAAIASLPISQTNMMRGQDNTDFNFANSNAAKQLRDNTNLTGGTIPLLDALYGLPSQMKLDALNRGQVPTYTDGMITGTKDFGFGNDPNVYPSIFADTAQQVQSFDNTINDGSDNNDPEIIRRRMAGEIIPEEELDPVLSDDLAVNYLQNPNYLYSGQGNLYQPYGYAQGTLVDLLRTRNLTQPQQAAANLGLFGNPGDFS